VHKLILTYKNEHFIFFVRFSPLSFFGEVGLWFEYEKVID